MSQPSEWPFPLVENADGATVRTALNQTIEALLTEHSGAGEPADKFARMKWADLASFVQKRRNATNDAWNTEHALNVRVDYDPPIVQFGALSASVNRFVFCPSVAWYAVDLVVISDTATSASTGGNNWAFQVRDLTAGQNLFGTAKSTNGDELAINTAKVWTFDTFQSIAQNAVLQIQITKNGAPTSPLADVACLVRGYPRGS